MSRDCARPYVGAKPTARMGRSTLSSRPKSYWSVVADAAVGVTDVVHVVVAVVVGGYRFLSGTIFADDRCFHTRNNRSAHLGCEVGNGAGEGGDGVG